MWNLPTTCLLTCTGISYICDSGFSCYVMFLDTQVIALKCFKLPSRHYALIVYLLQALVVVIRNKILDSKIPDLMDIHKSVTTKTPQK